MALLGGVAAAMPLPMRAQQKAMPVIGFLHFASPDPFAMQAEAFSRGLSKAGYIEGKNVAIEYRWAHGHYDRLPSLVADLVARKVDLIAAIGGTPAARAAKVATSTIPIVFIGGDDPVAAGLVASLSRPGGNLTGVSLLNGELHPKRLELLAELVPRAKVVTLLVNPKLPDSERQTQAVQAAAGAMGLQLFVLKASTDSEIDTAFANLAQLNADALVVASDPFFSSRQQQLVELASRYAIPAIYQWREFAAAGGLISYGTNLTAVLQLVGSYAAEILSGKNPADLPMQQPTTFELVINLKTAKSLGLTVPQSLLQRADEVIE